MGRWSGQDCIPTRSVGTRQRKLGCGGFRMFTLTPVYPQEVETLDAATLDLTPFRGFLFPTLLFQQSKPAGEFAHGNASPWDLVRNVEPQPYHPANLQCREPVRKGWRLARFPTNRRDELNFIFTLRHLQRTSIDRTTRTPGRASPSLSTLGGRLSSAP